MKTTRNNLRLLLLQCIGFILTGCTIYGYAPIGIGYFGAMYATGKCRAITLLTTAVGLSCNLGYVDCTKYLMVMLMIAGISTLYENYRKERISTYVCGALTSLSVGLMELTDMFLSFDTSTNTYVEILSFL